MPPPGPKEKGAMRWGQETKTWMAASLFSALTPDQQREVRDTGKVPDATEHSHLKRTYKEIHDRVLDELKWEPGTPKPTTTQATRLEAQAVTVKFARTGSIANAPPHVPGWKDTETRLRVLKDIRVKACEGFVSENGVFYYKNIKEAVARSPQIDGWVQELGFKRPESVWKLLKKHFPELYIGQLVMKKKRNHAQTMVRAACEWLHGGLYDGAALPWYWRHAHAPDVVMRAVLPEE